MKTSRTKIVTKQIAIIINKHGGKSMLVGGAVRDSFFGICPKDFDIEIFGIKPDNLNRNITTIFRFRFYRKRFWNNKN